MVENIDRFCDTDALRENDVFRASFKDVLSDTLSSVVIFLIIGVVAVLGVSFAFGLPFQTSFRVCALVTVGIFIAIVTGWL